MGPHAPPLRACGTTRDTVGEDAIAIGAEDTLLEGPYKAAHRLHAPIRRWGEGGDANSRLGRRQAARTHLTPSTSTEVRPKQATPESHSPTTCHDETGPVPLEQGWSVGFGDDGRVVPVGRCLLLRHSIMSRIGISSRLGIPARP